MVVGISRKIQDLGSVIWVSGSKQLANLSRSMASIAIFVCDCLGLGDGGRGLLTPCLKKQDTHPTSSMLLCD